MVGLGGGWLRFRLGERYRAGRICGWAGGWVVTCGVGQLPVDPHLGRQVDHTALDLQVFGLCTPGQGLIYIQV